MHFDDVFNNQLDFYKKYKIQIPFFKWNEETLFRISIQAYNSKKDIDMLIDSFKKFKKY